MTGWTTVPRWLYENDLPDDELQEVYVKAARLKVHQLRTELAAAEAFLAEAEASLRHYQAAAEAQGRKKPQRLPRARLLPVPPDE